MSLYDNASLVMIPSGVKEDKLYSVKPTDGSGDFTFSRGSDIQATRVNSSGLIEKAKVNAIIQSNTLDTHWASQLLGSVSGSQSGYDGSSDAWLLTPTASTGQHHISNTTTGLSGVYTWSAYVKAGGKSFAFLQCVDSGGGNFYGYYNLSDGTSTSNNYGGSGTIIQTTTENVGGGWYRLIMVLNGSGATAARVGIAGAASAGAHNVTLAVTDTLFVQDAQLNHGLIAQDYVETTTTAVVEGLTADLPRLDYSGGASCPSLLLEPSRTNLFTYSEFGGAWGKAGSLSFTDNYGISPEGVQNAARFVSGGGSYPQLVETISGLTIGQDYTASFYVKSDGTTQIEQRTWFTGFAGASFTPTDEWQRITFTITATNTSHVFLIFTNSPTAPASSFLLYGIQIEQGSYPTSYIPTYGTAANRGADAASKTGVSSLIGQTEGTMFVELDYTNTGQSQTYITISDGTLDNRITLSYSLTLNCLNAFARVGGSTQALMTSATSPANGIKKIAVAYKLNDYRFYINGTEVAVDSTALVPTCSRIDVGSLLGFGNESSVKQALLFKTRLTNAELAALTTI